MMTAATTSAIAYILKGYPRISETFISNEILMLEKMGFNIHLIPMRHPRESFCHASVKQIKAPVDYLPTEMLQELPRLLVPNILLAKEQPERYKRALLLAAAKFRKNRKPATFKHLFQAGYMTRVVLDKHPEIVHLHGHFAHSPTSVTMFGSILSGRPFSFTAHAKDIYTSNPDHLREKVAAAKFAVTCTKHNADYLKKLAEKHATGIHTIYHGIDTRLFDGPGAGAAPREPYRLLTVARITEKKGLPTIYRALALLRDRGIKFHHTLIGNGEQKEEITALIDTLDLKQNCSLLGTRTHDQVLEEYRNSDLFLLGCRIAHNGDRDGIPNVLVESLAMGLPALATDVSAIPELLFHEQTGLVVPPEEPAIMADNILRLLQDTQLRKNCIANGQKLVKEGFDNLWWTAELAKTYHKEIFN